MSSKFSLIVKGSSFRVLQTFVSIVIGLLMMPFLIATLGQELYGLWIVISSVVTSYYLLDLGFNQAVTRYVAKYIHKDDAESANRVINTALVIYSLLGVVLLCISVVAAFFGAAALMDDVEHLSLAQTILIISGLSLALEFPAKAFPGIISAYMRFDVIATVRFTKSIIDAVLIYLAVSHGYGLVAMASITFVTGILSTLIYVRYSSSLFKSLKFDAGLIDKKTFKSIFQFSKWVFIFDFTAMMRDKMDVWFISFYLGIVVLPVYYVAVRLVEYAMQFMQQATGLSGPIFTEYYVKDERAALNRSFSVFMKVNIILGVTALCGFYVLGYSFIEQWMRGAVTTQAAFNCLIILALGRFMVYFTTPIQSMLMTLNKHRIGAWIAVGESLLSVVLCFWLIPKYQLIGAAFAIAIPYVVGRLIVLPLFVIQYIDVNFLALGARAALYSVISAGLAFYATTILSVKTLSFYQIMMLGALLALYQTVISILIWSKAERLWIGEILQEKFKSLIRDK